MPVSGGGFEQSYNAQAGVDTETMMVVTRHVSQASNDKREVVPTLQQIQALPAVLGEVQSLITDNGLPPMRPSLRRRTRSCRWRTAWACRRAESCNARASRRWSLYSASSGG